jgi:hypothetical protein
MSFMTSTNQLQALNNERLLLWNSSFSATPHAIASARPSSTLPSLHQAAMENQVQKSLISHLTATSRFTERVSTLKETAIAVSTFRLNPSQVFVLARAWARKWPRKLRIQIEDVLMSKIHVERTSPPVCRDTTRFQLTENASQGDGISSYLKVAIFQNNQIIQSFKRSLTSTQQPT